MDQNSRAVYYLPANPEAISSIMVKENKCEIILPFDLESLLPFRGTNLIETNLRTCNILTGQYISYKFKNQF